MDKTKKKIIVLLPFIILAIVFFVSLGFRLNFEKKYKEALLKYKQEEFDDALKLMEEIEPYKDSSNYILRIKYQEAEEAYEAGKIEEAKKIYEQLGDYKDSLKKVSAIELYAIYEDAKELFEKKSYFDAKEKFESLGEYGDSKEWIDKCETQIRCYLAKRIYAGTTASYAVDANGKLLYTYNRNDVELPNTDELDSWSGLISISGKGACVAGIDIHGNVYSAEAEIKDAPIDTSSWTNMLQVSTGDRFVVGLKADKTVVASGRNAEGQLDVSDWKNIVQVECGRKDTVALDKDGKIHIAGKHSKLADIINNDASWKNIVYISVGAKYGVDSNERGLHIAGLRKDGTVVAFGDDEQGQCSGVSKWKNIVKIAAGDWTIVGLDKDGKVYVSGNKEASGNEADYSGNVSDWHDIVDISAGKGNTIAVTKNGEAMGTGYNYSDKTRKYKEWSNILVFNP